MRRADIYGSAGLLILGLVVLFVIIPAEADGDTWSGVSPLFFPTLIVAGFTLSCAGLLVQAILRPKTYEGMPMPMAGWDFAFFLLACAIILGAVFVIHRFGLLWGGPLLVAALMLFMGERNWLRIVPMAVVPVLIFAFFITKVLNAPLP
jgi:hypothetical protein